MGRWRQRFENLALWKQKPSSGGEHNCTALGLEEAPVFYPTEEEFSDPLRFIAQIREQSEPYGICRIVPPKSWNPPFAIESQSFVFPTKHQSIHQLQERTAACDAETFKLEYGRYLEGEGRKLEGWPQFEGEALDLCKLYNAVKRHGGYKKVRDESKWGEVFRMIKDDSPLAPVATDPAIASLCQLYESYLHSYEIHQANVSAGKLLRMSKRQGMDVKHVKAKRVGRKRLGEDEQEEAQVGKKRRGMSEGDEAGDIQHLITNKCSFNILCNIGLKIAINFAQYCNAIVDNLGNPRLIKNYIPSWTRKTTLPQLQMRNELDNPCACA